MRLSLRFLIPLLLAIAGFAYAVVPLVDNLTTRWFIRDLDLRATLIANTLHDPMAEIIGSRSRGRMLAYFNRITQDERLYAVGYCGTPQDEPLATAYFPAKITCASLDDFTLPSGTLLSNAEDALLVSVRALNAPAAPQGQLIFVHDLSFVASRSEETRKYLFYFFLGLGFTISLITVVIAQLSWRGWVQGLRALLRGEGLFRPSDKLDRAELRPIASDLRALIHDIEAEHRARDADQMAWEPDTQRTIQHRDRRGPDVNVVSTREPYIHVRENGKIAVQRPASGLVTAMEPIMRACSGTWIAHGSGSADREVVDARDRVAVPGERGGYHVRRIWLSPEQEQGYYYGFANEGLWPLCHIAHVRPTFRTSDWEQYVQVNRMFAHAVSQEAKRPDPIVLVQDYHLALLPRMIHEALPAATIITFWHIPWPNPEAFGICPWREEVLDGLLGSNILGFHTQFHCNNFVDTVDRLLEARVDRETFNVTYRGKTTAVKRYPISVEWPPVRTLLERPVEDCRREVLARHQLAADHLIGVGIDRLDYTKGIEERFRAIERLLELHPRWVGKFSFVQIAAPSRSSIEQYQDYDRRVRALAARINDRYAPGPPPIILHVMHHEPQDVYMYYRAADLCFVSSLHDGMNLVAKEFVSARDDERGVLILSQFTGAARELPEAIVVNPYDTDQCAAALNLALSMPAAEQRARIRLMRGLIREFNVYRWAGRMLMDAAGMRRRSRLLQRVTTPDHWRAPSGAVSA